MSYSSQISQLLLTGDILCAYAYPKFFQQLSQDAALHTQVQTTLSALDRHLIQTPSGNAFYAVHCHDAEQEKTEAKKFFFDIIQNMRHTLAWFELFSKINQQDIYVQAGDRLYYSDVLNSLTYNQSLQQKLKEILTLGAITDINKMTDELFKKLTQKDKVMILIDRHKKQYQFTGKLELIQQALIFIVEHNHLYQEDDSSFFTEQRALL